MVQDQMVLVELLEVTTVIKQEAAVAEVEGTQAQMLRLLFFLP